MPSSTRAESRTLRLTTPSVAAPPQSSPRRGPKETLPRLGFSPNNPHSDAGIRIDPPPSLACAIGTIPAATAAAEPPLDPPVECLRFQGLWLAPYATGSVVTVAPNSGVLVFPKFTSPRSQNIIAR
jgi:hypothetical protein